jgi:hypothetical protein
MLSTADDSEDFFVRVESIIVKVALLILLCITSSKLIWGELAPFIREIMESFGV